MKTLGDPVDVVVPVKNEFEKLTLCCRALRSNIPINNLIIASANTTQKSIKIIKDLADIPLFDEEAIGAGRVRGLGLTHVQTDYYASVDADVIISKRWYPWCISQIKNPQVAACQGYPAPLGHLYRYWQTHPFTTKGYTGLGDTMLRTEAVREVGMPTEGFFEDHVLRARLEANGYQWLVNPKIVSTHLINDIDLIKHWYWYGKFEPHDMLYFLSYLLWVTQWAALRVTEDGFELAFYKWAAHVAKEVGSLVGHYSDHSTAVPIQIARVNEVHLEKTPMETSSIIPILRIVLRDVRPRLRVLLQLARNKTVLANLESKNHVKASLRRQNILRVANLITAERNGSFSILDFSDNGATIGFPGLSPFNLSLDDLEFLKFIEEKRIEITSILGSYLTVRIGCANLSIIGPISLLKNVIRAILFSDYYKQVDVTGKVVVDIGAFIGDSAICYASQGAKSIYAYEPSKEFFEIAQKNTAKYRNIFLHNYGLGREDRTAYLSGSGLGKAISKSGNERVEIRDAKAVLYNILQEEPEIGLLKMNCEGCEWELLDRVDRFILDRVSVIHIQIHSGDHKALLSNLTLAGFNVKKEEHPPEYPAFGTYVLEKQRHRV